MRLFSTLPLYFLIATLLPIKPCASVSFHALLLRLLDIRKFIVFIFFLEEVNRRKEFEASQKEKSEPGWEFCSYCFLFYSVVFYFIYYVTDAQLRNQVFLFADKITRVLLKNKRAIEHNNISFHLRLELEEKTLTAEKEKEALPFEDPVCITLEYFRYESY